jgi:hypothetical protein
VVERDSKESLRKEKTLFAVMFDMSQISENEQGIKNSS